MKKCSASITVFFIGLSFNVFGQYICNPLNLSYRFRPETDEISRREAADPTMVFFRDTYFLFASKTGGYWWSDDLTKWNLVETRQIPTEAYAPTAIAIGDTLFFLASSSTNHYPFLKSVNPKDGQWEIVRETFPFAMTDPALFLDDDNRLYLYWGCSDKEPLYGVELDMQNNFEPIGEPQPLTWAKTMQYGWENPGDYNELTQQAPWIEGPWVTKHNNKYYMQYSGPGTEYKSYADAVYVADHPLGPFVIQKHNPFAYKPEGFACGAGHGSSFADVYGNLWQIGTITISVKHKFERRLGLFPAFIDDDGVLFAYTGFGDYPFAIPEKKIQSPDEIFPGWMLLSYNKETKASSTLDGYESKNAVNEDIRTYWSAASTKSGEWLQVDLGIPYPVHAVQVNFAESDAVLYERKESNYYQYVIEYSNDGSRWKMLTDKSDWMNDTPHDLNIPDNPVMARFIRISGFHVPDGYLAISGLRVFGKGTGSTPSTPAGIKIDREWQNKRNATLTWKKDESATGYNIRYGLQKDKLYLDYIVYDTNTITIRSLNAALPYYFTITGFNENGIGEPSEIIEVK
jgi:xylan 1,4-beta-xylosidase